MRKTTKLLSLVLAALMLVGMCTVSAGAAFTDVSVENEALYEAVELLSTLGVAKGTTETTFGPDELVTRQQMAAFVYRLMKAGRQQTGGTNNSGFTDLDDPTFYYMITWASQAGIIKGRNATTFDPKGNIVLQDAYVMLVRALGYEEDTVLPYPFGYIDLAEEIGLSENIPTTVNYTDALTRGQVAILLANAFYADMNKTTVEYDFIPKKYTEREPDGMGGFTEIEKTTWAYAAVETAATVAKDIFGVEEETFVVTATNNYTFGASQEVTEDEIDMVIGNRYDEDGNVVATAEAWEVEDLKLDGKSDEYFMAELTLFVKKDAGKDVTKDEVIAAKSNLNKQTVAAKDVVIETSTKTDAKYYVGGKKSSTADKVMTGLVSFGNIDAYLDKDAAPYAYRKLGNGADKDSVKFIKLDTVSIDEEGASYKYVAEPYNYDGQFNTLDATGAYATLTTNFANEFKTVYNNGLYEAEVYDVNGDGYAEYVFIKNLTFVQLTEKNAKNILITDVIGATTGSTTKYEDIVIVGDYEDGDAVLAYGHKNATKFDYLEVKETIAPVEATVTSFQDTTKSDLYTLSTGEVVDLQTGAAKYAYYKGHTLTLGKLAVVYVKDGVLLYADSVAAGNFDAAANYAIVIAYEENAKDVTKYVYTPGSLTQSGTATTASGVDQVVFTATGVTENGEFSSYYYVNAIIDGDVKAVKLADAAFTYVDYDAKTKKFSYNLNAAGTAKELQSQALTEKAVVETVMYEDFYGKFSTYTVNTDGSYVFSANDIPEAKKAILADTAKEDAVYYEAATGSIEHYTGKIYNLTGITDVAKASLRDYSKVILKTYDDDGEAVFTVYTADTLGKIGATNLKDIKVIFVNNKSGSIENIGIMYAEVVGEIGSDTANDYRIILSSSSSSVDGKTKYTAEVLNIKDGTKASVEADTNLAAKAPLKANWLVEIKEDGKATTAAFTPTETYAKNKIMNVEFNDGVDTYDEGMKFLDIKDGNLYTLNDETTILFYEGADAEITVADDSILTADENSWSDNLNTKFQLLMVAVDEEDDATSNIKIVKTLVVAPAGKIEATK